MARFMPQSGICERHLLNATPNTNDLSKIAGDLAGFNAQKDNPRGKKTMRSYLWMVCDAEIG